MYKHLGWFWSITMIAGNTPAFFKAWDKRIEDCNKAKRKEQRRISRMRRNSDTVLLYNSPKSYIKKKSINKQLRLL